MDTFPFDTPLPEDLAPGESRRPTDPDELSFRAALESAVSGGAGEDKLAEIVVSSRFIVQLVRQYTGRRRSGSLYEHYSQVLGDWRSATLQLVWTNARAGGGKLVRESLRAKNFGGYWNYVVRLKSLTARGRVHGQSTLREENGREFTDLPGPASDDPSLEAEFNELRARLEDASRSLPTDLHRLVLQHIIDGTYDPKKIAILAMRNIERVRQAAAQVLAWLRRILGVE
jgi:hypothetical protein